MTKDPELNIARIVYDSYPPSNLLPIDPGQDCRDLTTLMRRVCEDDIGDPLFRFLVVEIIEGGEGTLSGAIRVVRQARDDVEAVLRALVRAKKKEDHCHESVQRDSTGGDHRAPTPTNRQEELRLLDQQATALRKELGYSQPGEVIWQARLDFDELLVVEADGYGKAVLLRVSGNYPSEYIVKEQREFDNEESACAEAGKQAAERES